MNERYQTASVSAGFIERYFHQVVQRAICPLVNNTVYSEFTSCSMNRKWDMNFRVDGVALNASRYTPAAASRGSYSPLRMFYTYIQETLISLSLHGEANIFMLRSYKIDDRSASRSPKPSRCLLVFNNLLTAKSPGIDSWLIDEQSAWIWRDTIWNTAERGKGQLQINFCIYYVNDTVFRWRSEWPKK